MKKRIISLILSAALFAGLLSGCGIAQTEYETTIEIGTEFVFDASDYFDVSKDKAAEFEIDTSSLDINTLGSYSLPVTYKKNEYTLTVNVVDTTSPEITLIADFMITNESDNLDMEQIVEFEDLTECTASIRYADKIAELEIISGTNIFLDEFEAAVSEMDYAQAYEEGTDVLEEEGVYVGIVCVEDEGSNCSYEAVTIVNDLTPAEISGLEDKTVGQEDITEEPVYDISSVTITDNVDGEISVLSADVSFDLTDEENYVYTLTVSYEDLAGNVSTESCTYTVIEKEEETASSSSGSSSSGSSSKSGSSSSGSSSSGSSSSGSSSSGSSSSSSEPYYVESAVQSVLSLVNEERAAEGLSALTLSSGATSAAKVRAKELATLFSHTRPDGSACFTALDDAGVSYSYAGENIAAGYSSASSVMNGWMNSSGHKANILSENYTQIGIACYYDGSTYYWVQLFIG